MNHTVLPWWSGTQKNTGFVFIQLLRLKPSHCHPPTGNLWPWGSGEEDPSPAQRNRLSSDQRMFCFAGVQVCAFSTAQGSKHTPAPSLHEYFEQTYLCLRELPGWTRLMLAKGHFWCCSSFLKPCSGSAPLIWQLKHFPVSFNAINLADLANQEPNICSPNEIVLLSHKKTQKKQVAFMLIKSAPFIDGTLR